jgi:hypothetical protein
MSLRLNDHIVAKQAVAVSAGGGPNPIVATKVDGTGFSRARFVFNMNPAGTTGSLQTGLGVWKAATSGGTYAQVASAAAITSGVISGAAQPIVVIDVPIDSANPWLQMSGSFLNSGPAHGAVVELYKGVNRPPTQAELQVIVA